MIPLIITLLILGTGWRAYQNARRGGTWSNKQFLVTLLGTLGLGAVISLPIILVTAKTAQAHEGFFIVSLLLAIALGVILLTIYMNRWRKRDLLRRSGQDRAVGAVIAAYWPDKRNRETAASWAITNAIQQQSQVQLSRASSILNSSSKA